MGNAVGVFVTPGTVGPLAFGADPGDSLFIALLAERGPVNVPTLLTSFGAFTALFGGPTPRTAGTQYSAGYEVLRDFFAKGGRRAYVLRIAGAAVAAAVALDDRATPTPDVILTVTAKGPGTWANALDFVIAAGTQADTYKLTLRDAAGDTLEVFDNLKSDDVSCERVNAQSAYINITRDTSNTTAAPDNLPALGTFDLNDTTAGTDDNDPTNVEIVGTVSGSARTGLETLATFRYGRGLLVAPDLDSDATVIAKLKALSLPYFRVYLTSSQEGATLSTVLTQRAAHNADGTGFWFPRIRGVDEFNNQLKTWPALGQIAAIWLQEIAAKGAAKAPAGAAFRITGGLGLERQNNGMPLITEADAEILVAAGINPIWDRDNLGACSWGGRAATTSTAWKYLACAYVYCVIGNAIRTELDKLVYEVIGEEDFSAIYLGVYRFMADLHRAGTFRGALPDPYSVPDESADAFAIQCGPEFQTVTDNANGNIRVKLWFKEALTGETFLVEVAKQTA